MSSPSSNNNLQSSLLDEDVPHDFLCPITHELMVDPLMTRTGLSFDREAIMKWLAEHDHTCPLTRQPLRASDLVPNRYLERKIAMWCEENQRQKPQVRSEENRDDEVFLTFLASSRKERKPATQEGQQRRRRPVITAIFSRH